MLEIINSRPQDDILKESIQFYYFLRRDETSFVNKFTHFPHYRTTINAYRNADIQINENSRTIRFDPNAEIQSIFTNNVSPAKQADIKGPIDVIGVTLNPLGINHFIEKNFFVKNQNPVIRLNNQLDGLNIHMANVFDACSIREKTELLDNYFRSIYSPYHQRSLFTIVNAVLESKGLIQVNEIERKYGTNRRTLLRMFKKSLGCSISEFKQVVRFRNAIDSYQNTSSKPSFTALSHRNNYYDQSDFIYHFKALAREIPSEVLNQMSTLGDQELIWKIKN